MNHLDNEMEHFDEGDEGGEMDYFYEELEHLKWSIFTRKWRILTRETRTMKWSIFTMNWIILTEETKERKWRIWNGGKGGGGTGETFF